ncbi:MAG: PP2C family protein-serine/threonine phosphatase, partial [Rhodothermales bacterium]|nr:PP2C family protein-serine/threonine phosphatase [Rhodothermales bacterium]
MVAPRPHSRRTDGLVYALGLAGFVLFFLGLPRIVPEGAASLTLSNEAIRLAATQFLIDHGYESEGLEWEIHPRKDPAFLDTLQKLQGRSAALETIRASDGVPAFHWFVRGWLPAVATDTESDADVSLDDDPPPSTNWFELRLDDSGHVWWFNSSVTDRVFQAINRTVLFRAIPDTGRTAELFDMLARLPDSTLLGAMVFGFNDSLNRSPGPPPGFRPDGERGPRESGNALVRMTPLRRNEAIRIARTHLNTLMPGDYRFAVDTLYTQAEGSPPLPLPRYITRSRAIEIAYDPDRASSLVVFTGTDPNSNLPVQAEMLITAGGLLLRAEILYEAGRPPSNRRERGFTLNITLDLVAAILASVLAIFVVVLFFRRLSARLIDVKSALQDALMGGIFLAMIVALTMGHDLLDEEEWSWSLLLVWALPTLLSGSIGGFITFIVSSATDSIARMTWPQKMQALTYTRNFNYYNVTTGIALVRGLAVGGVLLGTLVGLLMVLHDAPVLIEGDEAGFLGEFSLSAAGFFIGVRGWTTQLLLLVLLLGIGPELARRLPSMRLSFGAMVGLLTLLNPSPVSLFPEALTMLVSAAIAVIVIGAFWRYDFIVCFIALLVSGLLWDTAPGWLPEGAPDLAEAVVVWAFVGGIFLLGLVGLVSGRTAPAETLYLPAYLQEIAQQERLRGELETAHRVQASFLPSEMPNMPGVDIAALCLPAQEVGGDYYDFIRIDDRRLAIVVGDVSGKGIQAAFFMTLTKGFLRALCREVLSPAAVLSRVNALFFENAPRGMFISMIYGILDTRDGTFTFVRAGHDPVIARRMSERKAEFVRPGGMALGLATGALFDDAIHETTLHLHAGDILAFYTDGCTDSLNALHEQFGSERLLATVAETPDGTASDILRHIVGRISTFSGSTGRPDDLTVVIVRIDGIGAALPA